MLSLRRNAGTPRRGRRSHDRDVPWRRRLPWLLLLVLGIALRATAPHVAIVRDAYAGTFYPLVSRGLGAATGWIPFSVAEPALVILTLLLLLSVYRGVRRVRLGQRRFTNLAACGAVNALALAGLAYGGAMVLWGVNYHRVPLTQELGYDAAEPSPDELRALAAELVEATNATRGEVLEDGGVMRLPDIPTRALARAPRGFERAAQLYEPLTRGYAGRAKRSLLFSSVLSYLGLAGMFVPYTAEPTVNGLLPDAELPFTACHEIAHQMGYAREDEASFVGYLVCARHPDPDYRYSANLAALRYALSALGDVSEADRREIVGQLRPEVLRDLAALRTFWERYESKVSDVGERVNDLYLKAQGQTTGTASYGAMVDLLLAQRRASRSAG
jgi:Protein of unknown function (DUF3810)